MEHLPPYRNIYAKRWKWASINVEEILEAIKNLPLKEVLTYLIAHGITNFAGKGFERIKKFIQERENEQKYAFVPDKEEAKRLLNFKSDPNYRLVSLLVPNYRHIDLIRAGLLIDYYHKNDNAHSRERVGQIKHQISSRPNGRKLLKIANLPTTPFFSVILQRLQQLNIEGYAGIFLEETFDESIQEWVEASKLVESQESVASVVTFCIEQINKRKETFFVLGMKFASNTVGKALGKLITKGILDENNYTYALTTLQDGNNPRTQLMVYKKEI